MSRVVTEHKGIKYSLQPHGLKSRVLVALAFFVVAFGGALLAATPASAATSIGVSVCGSNSPWYVNDDEADRVPVSTSAGLVFESTDLIHFEVDIPLDELLNPTGLGYVADPAPDQPSFFSVEVRSDLGGYGTLRWDGSLWWITIGAGQSLELGSLPATAGTYSNVDAVELLKSKVTKWGPFDPLTDNVVSFGVGYTKNPPGSVASTVSSVSFQGESVPLTCPATPSPTPTPTPTPTTLSPTPVVVVPTTKITTAKAKPAAALISPGKTCAEIGHRVHVGDLDYASGPGKPDADGDGVGCESYPELVVATTPEPTLTPSTTPIPRPSYTPPPLVTDPVSDESGMGSLRAWGIGVAGVAGAILTFIGVAGIVRRRRYQGTHHVSTDETQVMPAANGDDYSVSDYNPSDGGYDPALGGHAGESFQGRQDTIEMPPVNTDTKVIPPVE